MKNPYRRDTSLVYEVPRWDAYNWNAFTGQSPKIQRVMREGEKKHFAFPAFGREVFHRLYSPSSRPIQRVKPENAWAKQAHEHLGEVPDFDRLARRCRGDRFMAGVAATAFSEKIYAELPEASKEVQDPQPLRDQVRGLKAMQQRAADAGKPFPEQLEKMRSGLVAQGKNTVQAAQEYAARLDAWGMRQAIRAACTRAEEKVNETMDALAAFSFGEHDGVEGVGGGLEEKLKLAQRIQYSDKLQRIAREAGRLRRLAAQKQRSKADHARSEVSSIETGNELSRLLPAELVKLAAPALWGLFAKGYTEQSLLQYRLSGKERQGRGPLVVCLDSSGSMQGRREVWSKAVALALLDIAVAQRRTCRVLHFDNAVRRVDDFVGGKVNTRDLLASMDVFYGGGTNFARPLIRSLDAIEREKQFKQADVVVITDGEYAFESEFVQEYQEESKRLEFSTYGVVIGHEGTGELSRVSQQVLCISGPSQEAGALGALFSL